MSATSVIASSMVRGEQDRRMLRDSLPASVDPHDFDVAP
jgi:hypothetical protein